MNSSDQKIVETKEKNQSFLNINQQVFTELLTFVDFSDEKLNIGFVEVNFAKDRDILIKELTEHQDCQNIQFEVLHFLDPGLRFLRDELVAALKNIEVSPNKKLVLLITGLEQSIGVLEEYPDVLTNLNFVRDDLRHSVNYPLILFLPQYALTRLAKYAPDFWAWRRKVFSFKTITSTLDATVERTVSLYQNSQGLALPDKQERIDLLLGLLSEYNSFDLQESRHNLPVIINIYNQLSTTYYSIGKYQQSIKFAQQSLQIARTIGDRSGEASSLGNLGNIYYALGEYQQTIDYHQQALEIFQQIGNRNEEANSLNNLGNLYSSLGEYQQAIDYYQKSLVIKQQIGNRNGESNSLNNLSNVYYLLGEYQRTIDYLQQSLEIFQQIGNRNGEASSLVNLGNVYYSIGEYQQSINFSQQSLEIFQQIGNRNGEANSLGNLGSVYYSLGEYQQSIDYLQQSLEIVQQIGDRQGEANALGNLSNVYYSLGDYQQSIDLAQQSLEIFQQIGNHNGEAVAWVNLGLNWTKLHQKSQAKTAFENSKKLYQAIGLEKKVEDCDKAIQNLEIKE